MLFRSDLTSRVNADATQDFRMRVRCSSGTYIRTLAHDIGERLGQGGHLIELRRTRAGHFDVADALSLDRLQAMTQSEVGEAMISASDMLSHLSLVRLDPERVRLVENGRGFLLSEQEAAMIPSRTPIRLCDQKGLLVAVGVHDEGQSRVKPIVVIGSE